MSHVDEARDDEKLVPGVPETAPGGRGCGRLWGHCSREAPERLGKTGQIANADERFPAMHPSRTHAIRGGHPGIRLRPS